MNKFKVDQIVIIKHADEKIWIHQIAKIEQTGKLFALIRIIEGDLKGEIAYFPYEHLSPLSMKCPEYLTNE